MTGTPPSGGANSAGPRGQFSIWSNAGNANPRVVSVIKRALVISGAISLIIGLVVIIWTAQVITFVAVLFGAYFIFFGLLRLVYSFVAPYKSVSQRLPGLLIGVLLIAAGVVSIADPSLFSTVVGIIAGAVFVLQGIAMIVDAVKSLPSSWFGLVVGALVIAAGVVIIVASTSNEEFLAILLAVCLVVFGLLQFGAAIALGRATKKFRGQTTIVHKP